MTTSILQKCVHQNDEPSPGKRKRMALKSEVEMAELHLESLCSLFQIFFYQGLHLTYMSFLFPVVSRELRTVFVCFILSIIRGFTASKNASDVDTEALMVLEKAKLTFRGKEDELGTNTGSGSEAE